MDYFRQCDLQRGTTHEIAWIPEQFAVLGKYLRIGDRDGWRVVAVYGRKPSAYLLEHERDYLTSFPSLA